jgi:hypothetical protein
MTNTVKKAQERYFSPTPKKWRKLGDALLAVSTTVTTYAIVEEYKWIALAAVLLGAVGKFMTNFFSEE